MHKQYLGDSYDLVKRFFSQTLKPVGTLYAQSEFVPEGIRRQYSILTAIPVLGDENPKRPFGVLLDPDTGFTLGRKTQKHVSLKSILELNQERHPDYIICFDQSHHRKHELDRDGQREKKMRSLRESGLSSFYYKSHAPFLFTAQDDGTLRRLLGCLVSAGIPEGRFQGSGVIPAAAA
jgi:hypothetical protein